MNRTTIVILIAGAMLAVLLLAACVAPTVPAPLPPTAVPPTATLLPPTPTPTPVPPPATPTPLSPVALLERAFELEREASSYSFSMGGQVTSVSEALDLDMTMPFEFVGEYQAPDRARGHMSMPMMGMSMEVDMIVIGDQTYIRGLGSQGWELSEEHSAVDMEQFSAVDPSEFEVLELAGEEVADGVPVHHLVGTARFPESLTANLPAETLMLFGDVDGTYEAEYWIRQEDGRLASASIHAVMVLSGTNTLETTTDMTMTFFGYDEMTDAIEAPELGAAEEPQARVPISLTVTAPLLPALEADTADGHLQRGLQSAADGRLGLAAAHLDRVVAERPDWADGYLYRGALAVIDGDFATALDDLDRAVAMEAEQADGYALRAWVNMIGLFRDELDVELAMERMGADLDQALLLEPDHPDARVLKAFHGLVEALLLAEVDEAAAIARLGPAIADLEAAIGDAEDSLAGYFVGLFELFFQLNMDDEGWLQGQIDDADARLAVDPDSYMAHARRGLARSFMAALSFDAEGLRREVDADLLRALALAHDHLQDLADPAGGPFQVARIWGVEEAIYGIGQLYLGDFFYEAPAQYPEFADMLSTYWGLQDHLAGVVDDPIVFAVAFSPDGSRIATVSESGPSYLRVWDAAGGEQMLEVALNLDGLVLATTHGSVSWRPDGEQILVAYTNPTAHVIDAGSGETVQSFTHESSTASAAFSPDGSRVATAANNTVFVWDAESGEQLLALEPPDEGEVATAAFNHDGSLVIGGGDPVHVWDAESGELVATLPGYDGLYVNAPAVSPDDRLLATPGYPVRIYDLESGVELLSLDEYGGTVRTVAFSPCLSPAEEPVGPCDDLRLATASFDGTARVLDADTGEPLVLVGHPRGVDAVAFSPDGATLVTSGSDGRFRAWDTETGAELWSRSAVTRWWEEAPDS